MAVTIGQVIALIKALGGKGGGGGGGGVSDVKVNETSVVENGVAKIPKADSEVFGVINIGGSASTGLVLDPSGYLKTAYAGATEIKQNSSYYKPIVPATVHNAAFIGLSIAAGDTSQKSSTNAVGVYTENAKSKIHEMLNAPENVSGTTPSITAKSGVRYICGEVSTLDIVAPASGCIDVVFESGSTATVLTVTSAKTGVTAIRWANGFDPSSLDANTRYEVIIDDGEWGMACAWT